MTPATPSFSLHLPEGTADAFTADMADIPADKWLTWRRHQVVEGETLAGIAPKYHVSAAAIADANGLDAHAPLEAGHKLIIPVPAQAQAAPAKLVRYRVRHSDTLEECGRRIRRERGGGEEVEPPPRRARVLVRGTRLTIYLGGAVRRAGPAKVVGPGGSPVNHRPAERANGPKRSEANAGAVIHHVQAGETLWSIAKAYKTTVEALRSGNQFLFSRPLQAGDTLMILPPR